MCCVKNVKQLEKEACCCQLCSELEPHGVLSLDRLGRAVHASTRHPWRAVQMRSLRTDDDNRTSGPFQRRYKGIRACSWHNVPSNVLLKHVLLQTKCLLSLPAY